jgi:DNA-binding transcriptional ArsR family regulator
MTIFQTVEMVKGRPQGSSPASYQKLYVRLLKGPLWVEDWKSTGLPRSVVRYRLRYLIQKGLVELKQEGKKKLFQLKPMQNQNGTITLEGIRWSSLLHPISRKEKRFLKRQVMRNVKKTAKLEDQNLKILEFFAKGMDDADKIIALPENKEILNALNEVGIDWKNVPIPNLLKFIISPKIDETICMDCLKKGKIVYLFFDSENGEVVCPEEAIVKRRDIFEVYRPEKERPSPFNPPEDKDNDA